MTLQSMGRRPSGDDPIAHRIADMAPWFHNLHLPSGHETAPDHPLGDFPSFKWDQVGPALASDLSGRRALDIGCNAGFYSFELAARGAEVIAVDVDDHYLAQARWAASLYEFGECVSFRRMGVYDLVDLEGTFDVVLFMGVLYHLRYPLLALDIVAEKVGDTLILQTLSMPGDEVVDAPDDLGLHERDVLLDPGWPKMAFIENKLAGDPTNWWAPNRACVEAMTRSSGLVVVDRPGHEIFVCRREGGVARAPELEALLRRPSAADRP